MCIIIDANAINDLNAPTEDGKPILRWLLTGGGGLVIGGKLKKELFKSPKLRSTIVTLSQAGKLHDVDEAQIEKVTFQIQPACHSDDPHIIAAAVISGCRLIFSRDQALHKDAKNKELLAPIAAIYQNKDHSHLLEPCHCN